MQLTVKKLDHQITADKLNAAHASLREMIDLNETTGDPDPEITDRARALLPENVKDLARRALDSE
jgi:hypothetical protein